MLLSSQSVHTHSSFYSSDITRSRIFTRKHLVRRRLVITRRQSVLFSPMSLTVLVFAWTPHSTGVHRKTADSPDAALWRLAQRVLVSRIFLRVLQTHWLLQSEGWRRGCDARYVTAVNHYPASRRDGGKKRQRVGLLRGRGRVKCKDQCAENDERVKAEIIARSHANRHAPSWAGPCTHESLTEQRRNERAGKAGDPQENPPTSGIVQHDSTCENMGAIPLGIELGSPWWEASSLTTTPPRPRNAFKTVSQANFIVINVMKWQHRTTRILYAIKEFLRARTTGLTVRAQLSRVQLSRVQLYFYVKNDKAKNFYGACTAVACTAVHVYSCTFMLRTIRRRTFTVRAHCRVRRLLRCVHSCRVYSCTRVQLYFYVKNDKAKNFYAAWPSVLCVAEPGCAGIARDDTDALIKCAIASNSRHEIGVQSFHRNHTSVGLFGIPAPAGGRPPHPQPTPASCALPSGEIIKIALTVFFGDVANQGCSSGATYRGPKTDPLCELSVSGAAPECNDQRHRPVRYPVAEIRELAGRGLNPVRLGGRQENKILIVSTARSDRVAPGYRSRGAINHGLYQRTNPGGYFGKPRGTKIGLPNRDANPGPPECHSCAMASSVLAGRNSNNGTRASKPHVRVGRGSNPRPARPARVPDVRAGASREGKRGEDWPLIVNVTQFSSARGVGVGAMRDSLTSSQDPWKLRAHTYPVFLLLPLPIYGAVGGRAIVSVLAYHVCDPDPIPTTCAIRIRYPAESLTDSRDWESCRTMPLVGGGFSRDLPFPPPLHSCAAPLSPHFYSHQHSRPRCQEPPKSLNSAHRSDIHTEIIAGHMETITSNSDYNCRHDDIRTKYLLKKLKTQPTIFTTLMSHRSDIHTEIIAGHMETITSNSDYNCRHGDIRTKYLLKKLNIAITISAVKPHLQGRTSPSPPGASYHSWQCVKGDELVSLSPPPPSSRDRPRDSQKCRGVIGSGQQQRRDVTTLRRPPLARFAAKKKKKVRGEETEGWQIFQIPRAMFRQKRSAYSPATRTAQPSCVWRTCRNSGAATKHFYVNLFSSLIRVGRLRCIANARIWYCDATLTVIYMAQLTRLNRTASSLRSMAGNSPLRAAYLPPQMRYSMFEIRVFFYKAIKRALHMIPMHEKKTHFRRAYTYLPPIKWYGHRLKSHRYTPHYENTAHQFRAVRVGAKVHEECVSV
ncbi:hypothetical protein PR048_004268 [Dryococelus australis]|uniref:Uncharacterized protein n=1 Tax=Dryococelus australis TaxID=614101 RepID=A0ABQ9I503_9NEOP|nr:hypothetical protein PR048_004268 [Dryococelus australis]